MKRVSLFLCFQALLIVMPRCIWAHDVEVDGIFYNLNSAEKTASVTYKDFSYNSYSGKVEIPSSLIYNGEKYIVTRIGSAAFYVCSDLTSVIIPKSVICIESNAFHSCHSLNSIILPNSVTEIEQSAFAYCRSLTTVTIPNSVTKIEQSAFRDCSGLTSITISNSVTSLENNVFCGCSSLTSVMIPNNIVSIDFSAFQDCCSLTSITIPNSVTYMGMHAFHGCSGLTSISLSNNLEKINDYVFQDCTNLTSIDIPSSVTHIAWYAFKNCSNLTSVTANGVSLIGKGGFEGCTSLTSINTPNLTYIAEDAFYGCTGLTSFTIPSEVLTIERCAFANCINLNSVLSEVQSPFNFSNDAFQNISSTAILTIPTGTRANYEKLSGWIKTFLQIVEENTPLISLSIIATGYGSVSYNGTTIKSNTQSFTLNEGTSATFTFAPDNGYQIKSVKVNSADVTSNVSNNSYTVSNIKANTTIEVEFEAIPIPTYTLYVKASGNGSATYSGTTAKNNTKSFSLNEGTSATIAFTPENGYRVKSVKVNSVDVTSSVSNNSYIVSNIKTNTTVEVEFEAIPIPTYTLSITASGNGSVSYSGTIAKNNTKIFTVNEGTSVAIAFTPDAGYRIKSVKVNSTDVTSKVSNNSYTISSISANTTVEVVFEAIPIPTYTLSITASGNGSVSYSGTSAKNNTKIFTVNEGTSAAIAFTPDAGYRIKSVKVNSTDVTSKVSNNSYTISSISANTTVEVVFEAIPIPTYTLSITASGNGSVSYSGTNAKNNTKTFTVNEGTSVSITFSPDNGYRIKSVKVNSTDVTSKVSNSSYTISSINANTTVDVVFEAIPVSSYTLKYIVDGETYKTYLIQEGATITPEAMPTKEGYTFSGWSEIPQIMPSMDVTVVGTFTKDEPTIKTYTLMIHASGNGSAVYGLTTAKNNSQAITMNQGTSPTITFFPDNGYRIKSVKVNSADVTSWVLNNSYTISSISADTTVEVEFEAIPVSSYTLKYVVDGETYKTYQVQEGAAIIPEAEPEKDGYTFSGWSDVPKVMPANDVTVTGTFIKNAPVIKYYTLSLKATGSGSVSYNGIVVENNTQAISIEEGVQVVVKFTPHDGYLIKSATMNGRQIADLSSMSFTIDIMDEDVTIEVEFEAIPVSSYTLKYVIDGETYKTFQIEEGTAISPEAEPTKEGYTFSGWSAIPATMPAKDMIITGSFIVNKYKLTYQVDGEEYKSSYIEYGASITQEVVPTKDGYTFSGWSEIPKTMPANDVIITGTFTKNPDETTISGKCGDNVFYSYNKETQTLTIYGEGRMYAHDDLAFYPWYSYQSGIHNVTVEYGVNDISAEAFYCFNELTSVTIPNSVKYIDRLSFYGCKSLTSITIPNSVMTIDEAAFYDCSELRTVVSEIEDPFALDASVFKGIPSDAQLIVPKGTVAKYQATAGWNRFKYIIEAEPGDGDFSVNGVNYLIRSENDHTVLVYNGNYSHVLEVPATISYGGYVWDVIGLKDGALDNCDDLAAIIWEPSVAFNARVKNPNLLLYVKSESYKSLGVRNVVVNGVADNIELTDAASGNDFYCPKAFIARNISYSHHYSMETGLGDAKGWETIVLPFDVKKYTSQKGEIVPFAKWTSTGTAKPFWLCELTANGYREVEGIKANTPYIISMPNNRQYQADYVITGIVTFSAENVEVKASADMQSATYQDRTLVPNYTNKNDENSFALNVKNYYVNNSSTDKDGSKFIKGLRSVHPFEAYMTTTSNTRSIDVFDGMTTAIREIVVETEGTELVKVYDTRGILVKTVMNTEDMRKGLAPGVYIVNGKKMIIK